MAGPGRTFFHALHDRLIQQQWQLDREQQYRVDHEPRALGALAQLPLELRWRIYRECLPTNYVDIDLVEQSDRQHHGSNLLSLMRTTRCIYDEVKPLIERLARSRLFNLLLSNEGVRFEGKQFNVDYLQQDFLQNMTSETIPPLGIFARTRNRIRNLRLTIKIRPTIAPPGLVAALEPFAMWVFSLLSRAEALQVLLVDFHLSQSFPAETLTNDDGSEMNVGRLIGTLLGARAAEHCQTVMKQALTSELQTVRFLVQQKSDTDGQQVNMIRSWRWNRPSQQTSQTETREPQAMHLPSQPTTAMQSIDLRGPPKYSPPPPRVSTVQSTEQEVEEVEPAYSPPPTSAQERLSAKSPSLGAGFIDAANGAEESHVISASIDADSEDDILSMTPRRAALPLPKSMSSSTKIWKDKPNTQVPDIALTIESESSKEAKPSQTTLRRRRWQRPVGERHKRRRLNLTYTSTSLIPQARPRSSSQTRKSTNSRSESPSIEGAAEKDEYVVQSLRDVRIKNGVCQIKVKWNGYDQMTWEPRVTLVEDVPDMVREFDKRHWKPPTVETANNSGAENSTALRHTLPQPMAGVAISDQVSVQSTQTPQSAMSRVNEWKAQKQSLSSPTSTSSHRRDPKYASKAPKRPLTAYFLYVQANRPGIWNDLCKKLGTPALVKEDRIANEGTRRWLGLEPEQRKIWENMHEKRVALYHVQMEAYKAGKPVPSHEQARKLTESYETSFMDLT